VILPLLYRGGHACCLHPPPAAGVPREPPFRVHARKPYRVMPSTPPKAAADTPAPATPAQIIEAAAAQCPESLRPIAQKIAPVLSALANVFIVALPYLNQAYDLCLKAYKLTEPHQGIQMGAPTHCPRSRLPSSFQHG
jgi:hypothetical protein